MQYVTFGAFTLYGDKTVDEVVGVSTSLLFREKKPVVIWGGVVVKWSEK